MLAPFAFAALAVGALAGTNKSVPPFLPAPVPALQRRAVQIAPELRGFVAVPETPAALSQLNAALPVIPASPTPPSPEVQAVAGGVAFDGGSAAKKAEAVAPGAGATASAAPFVVAADPAHAAWLERVVQTAARSKTARRVLADAKRMSEQRGQPIVVAVGEPREWAAFDFDTGVLWLPRSALRKSAKNGATTLAHELRHAVQLGSGLPDMFELELDAYMVDFRVAFELGDVAQKGTYDAAARAAFRKSPEDFIRYLRKYYKSDVARDGRAAEYRAELEESLKANLAARARLDALYKRRLTIYESMVARKYAPEALRAYYWETLMPLWRRIEAVARMTAWNARDLALHDDPETRKKTSDFARRAVRRLERLSGTLDVR